MPIHVRWDDTPDPIIRWDYDNGWSWQDSADAAEKTSQMRQARLDISRIAIILNMEFVETIPRDSLRNMRRLLQSAQPADIIILSGSSAAVNVMAAFMRSIFQSAANQIFTTASLTQAHMLVAQMLGGDDNSPPTQPSRPRPTPNPKG
jgi:hypothetical protein